MLILSFAIGCMSQQEVPHGTLVVSKEQQSKWVRNFNPVNPANSARWPTREGIYEPLMIYNAMLGEYIPWLGTSHRWNEQTTQLTITIREDVKWSDGEPFTAEDVKFTFDYLVTHPELDSGGLRTTPDCQTTCLAKKATDCEEKCSGLSDIALIDAQTVVFTFNKPSYTGLEKIAHLPIIPKHIWKDVNDPMHFANESPVGTGPFTEIIRFESQVWELGRNPHSWVKPQVKAIRFPSFTGNEQATLALLQGEIDWAGNFVPVIDRIYVSKDPEHHKYWYPNVEASVLLYPNNTMPPFDQPTARKALSMAINRQQIVEIAMHNYTAVADETGLSPSFKKWYNPDVDKEKGWTNFNPQRAGEIFDQLGYSKNRDGKRLKPDGKPFTLTIGVVSGWSDWVRAANVIESNLADIGIDARIEARDFGLWFNQLQTGKFELSIGWSNIGTTPIPFYEGMMSAKFAKPIGENTPTNWHRHANEQVEKLVKAFDKTNNEAKQIQIVQQMQLLFAKEAPALPLFLNPSWGQCNTTRFTGFPSAENPYARLSPNHSPESLLILSNLKPR